MTQVQWKPTRQTCCDGAAQVVEPFPSQAACPRALLSACHSSEPTRLPQLNVEPQLGQRAVQVVGLSPASRPAPCVSASRIKGSGGLLLVLVGPACHVWPEDGEQGGGTVGKGPGPRVRQRHKPTDSR